MYSIYHFTRCLAWFIDGHAGVEEDEPTASSDNIDNEAAMMVLLKRESVPVHRVFPTAAENGGVKEDEPPASPAAEHRCVSGVLCCIVYHC